MLSKKYAYALRGLSYLALHANASGKINLQSLSEGVDVPFFFLGKIMQELVRRKIVHSEKGPGGGFWLNEEGLELTAFDILKIIDPKITSSECLMGKKNCNQHRPCPLHFEFVACRENLFNSLKRTRLKDIAVKVKSGELFLDESL